MAKGMLLGRVVLSTNAAGILQALKIIVLFGIKRVKTIENRRKT